MGIIAVSSSVNHRRIARGREWLEARAPAEEVLIIGATADAANELARVAARVRGATFGYYHMTFGQLAATFTRPVLAARAAVPLGRLGVEAVVNRVLYKLAEHGALYRYARIANSPGFARAIADVITELRLEQIAPDALASVASDLGPFVQAYEAELADHGFTDWPGVLRLSAVTAADPQCMHQLLGLPTMLLDVPVTTASDLALVSALCSRTSEMLITVPANDTITLARIVTGLGTEIIDLDSNIASLHADEGGSLTRLQHHLFNDSSRVPHSSMIR